jgi:hypothetical protein
VISASPYSTAVYNEGPGLLIGPRLVLNFGLSVESGYDSNVFYLPAYEVGSPMLRLRAHVDMTTASSKPIIGDNSTANPVVDFRFSAQVEYREYLSSREDVQAQRSVNLLAATDVALFPRGPFTLRLVDSYLRSIDPRNAESLANFTRDYNRVGLIGSFRSGRFEYGLSDYFNVNWYESKDITFGNSLSNEGEAFARYRVLPRLLLSLTTRFGYVHYQGNSAVDGIPVRAVAGASATFTTWLGGAVAVGYGNSFNLHGPSFNSVIGSADLRFLLPRAARITLGYRRDFYDSLLANVYSDDQVYASFDQPFASRISAHLDGGVRFRHYIGLIDPAVIHATGFSPSDGRDDQIFDAHAELTVRCFSWLVAGLSYNLLWDRTDFAILSGGTATTPPLATPVHYIKHSAFARLDFAY